jgi:hypothetical protein
MGKSTISMVMFNSYVKLPEGKLDQEIGMEHVSEIGMEQVFYHPPKDWDVPISEICLEVDHPNL